MNFRATLIISFYNKIDWLKLVLAALEKQSMHDFEVIIADDGSKDEVVSGIKEIQSKSPLHIQHLWHPDIGFMKTTMLNKAIIASRSEYLIFIDGDCIPHRCFIEDHVRLQSPRHVLAGRRVNLSEYISKTLTVSAIRKGALEGFFFFRLLYDFFWHQSKDISNGIHFKSSFINKGLGTTKRGILGCNFSVTKQNLLEVNGFDERYNKPCVGEDTEIDFRFLKYGLTVLRPRFCLVQYHLWHKKLSRTHETANQELFQETKDKGYSFTPYGIKKS